MKSKYMNDRCTESDYRALFASSGEELRWLCYTLTGDEELSDKALDAALEQSLKGATRVFREWMLSWARRLIIRFCISTVRPAAESIGQRAYFPSPTELASVAPDQIEAILDLPADCLQRKLLRLDALSRFVFVLRAIEEYSRRDTALLLEIDGRTCEWLYAQAVRALQPRAFAMKSAGATLELVAV